MLLTGGVFAGTTWQSFDLVVPGINGSASTGSQTKSTTGALAGLQLNSSGGKTLDARTTSSGGNGSWLRSVQGGNTYSLESPQGKDQSVQLQFSTDFFSLQVAVTGNWRSN